MYGATAAKFYVQELKDKAADYYISWIINYIYGNTNSTTRALYLDALLKANEVTNVDFSNYIVMLNPPENHIPNEQIENYPYFKTYATNSSALFGGSNSYLIISGDVIYHYMNEDPYPIPEGECDIREGRFAIDEG